MSWLGLRHKGTEPLYSDEWNRVVDGLDILYGYASDLAVRKLDRDELLSLKSDIIPDQPGKYKLGDEGREWLALYGYYGYFDGNVYVQGKPVIKDGDPIKIAAFIEEARTDVDKFYGLTSDIKLELADVYASMEEIRADIERLYSIVSDIKSELRYRTILAQKVELGYAFAAAQRFGDVASGDVREIFLDNSPASGREANVVIVEVSAFGRCWLDIYYNNEKVAGGIAVPTMNLNLASGVQPGLLVEYGGQYTPGTLIHSMLVFPNAIRRALGAAADAGERVKIPPGYNLLLRVLNRETAATDMDVRIVWWEEPVPAPPPPPPPAVTNASGIDPNDPTWAPPEGWDKVWEFTTSDELNDFALNDPNNIYYASVLDDRIVFDPPSEDLAYVTRPVSGQYLASAAVCIKDVVSSVTDVHSPVYFGCDDGSVQVMASVDTVVGDTSSLALYDWVSGSSATFTNPNDWFVVVLDFANKVLRAYDRDKNVLAELPLSTEPSTGIRYEISLEEDNESTYTIDDVEVDWVAIKLAA